MLLVHVEWPDLHPYLLHIAMAISYLCVLFCCHPVQNWRMGVDTMM